jgi:predicted alpha-1,2-mannosidase
MKYFALLLAISSFGQTFAQISELNKASDKAQQIFDNQRDKYFSFDPLVYVNPFIGTGGHGHTFPGPVVPFGMVQVGPDTRYDGWDGCGGYHYSDSVIYGFSQTHLSGTGVPDYADMLVVPQIGKLNLKPGYAVKGGFGAGFSHSNEKASPGYYAVSLNNGIDVALTATERCAMHRYTFKGKGKRYILVDLGYRDKVLEVDVQKVNETSFQGKRISAAWATEQHFYFYAETSIPGKGKKQFNSKTGKYYYIIEFPANVREVTLKIGVSGVSEVGAKVNLDAEIPSFDFELVQRRAAEKWRAELTKIRIKTWDEKILVNYYTALYHAAVHPSLWSDVDGKFRDFNNQIQTTSKASYSVFSLWDTYRGANPLYTILEPEKVKDFVASFYDQYRCTGQMPMWTLSNNETYCMIGYHTASIIADAYAKGIELENPKALLDALVASSNYPQFGKDLYGKYGFIPAQLEAESVSKTLEYAYDDWCIARFAKQLGETEIARAYELRAANWLNVLHPESRFFQPRKGAVFLPFFVPNEVNHHFTEANAWQYALAAPHHITALTDIHGGKIGMQHFLDSLFYGSSVMSGRVQSDITGLIGQYAHGNEPSHHMGYLYNYASAPWKTQEVIDRILQEMYTNNPDGLSGNEDCGQMSAWYVLSAIGFYPVAPGSPTYAIGRPLVDHAIINGIRGVFEIQVTNNSYVDKYIQSITWNGKPYEKLFITHEMIQSGGLLEIAMGAKPAKSMANYEIDLKEEPVADFVPVPYFISSQTVFENELEVNMDKLFFERGEIYYSFDSVHFELFNPIEGRNLLLRESAKVFAKVVREDGSQSKVVSCTYTKFVKNCTLTLDSPYANQYPGAGSQTLVDGQRGTDEYRGTEWQGFNNVDVKGQIVFDQEKEVNRIKLSYLVDTRSWIFPPKSFTVEYSVDGIHFKKAGKVVGETLKTDKNKTTGELIIELVPTNLKYIRFTAENYGVCPAWHLAPGNPTWIFLDEVVVE